MVVLLSMYKPFIGLPFLNVSVIILYIHRSHVLRQILDENTWTMYFPSLWVSLCYLLCTLHAVCLPSAQIAILAYSGNLS